MSREFEVSLEDRTITPLPNLLIVEAEGRVIEVLLEDRELNANG